MLKKLAMGLALAAFSAAPLAAEPITLKLNSPAPPWSYLNIEIFTPWAEAVTAELGRHAQDPDLLRRNTRKLRQHL